jgi:hypothetical protein
MELWKSTMTLSFLFYKHIALYFDIDYNDNQDLLIMNFNKTIFLLEYLI